MARFITFICSCNKDRAYQGSSEETNLLLYRNCVFAIRDVEKQQHLLVH